MDVRTLIREDARLCIVVPQEGYMDTPSHKVPLIAVVTTNGDWWLSGEVSGTHWRFFKYGVECTWADLTDEQRYAVRSKTAWDGQVKDYWVELGYEDERWYTLEALL
jgi:hypothetical protein